MFKKVLILLMILTFVGVGVGYCDTLDISETLGKTGNLLEKVDLKQGIAYDVASDEIDYLSTIEIAKYKDIALEVGYSAKQKVVAAVSIPVLALRDYIALPILDLVEFNFGYFVGFDRIGISDGNNEFVHGPSVTLIKVKF